MSATALRARLRVWLGGPWLGLRCQIALGALFAAAALGKLADPPAFAKAMWHYELFPAWSIHPVALALPWLELLCGLALCLGLWVRAAATWIACLLLAFITALSINLVRKHPVDCGCFGGSQAVKTGEEGLADMRWTILRDLGMLALAAQILASGGGRGRKPRTPEAGEPQKRPERVEVPVLP